MSKSFGSVQKGFGPAIEEKGIAHDFIWTTFKF
jgi:hypothetical protein